MPDFAAIRFHIRTMKPVAKTGVTKFKMGTDASAAITKPQINTVSRLAFRCASLPPR